jgi:alpha-amylase/alpha-mannosidase (GH57 family)
MGMQPFVIHAHFYQPERTNPWTGVLDPEPSAAPARDWNDRIHGESYRPNGTARIVDEQRRVERIVNNYEHLSFNFGPTLLSWMERRAPGTYARIIDGDWRSVRRTGHGNALAQAYNHAILPLARERDRRTQIAWGLADFRHRFGRPAEGMWLPETAADHATIDALIDAGVGFTVLAPHQAHRVRHRDGEWHEVGADIDTGRAYLHRHSDGSGRSMAIFFYDGALAQSLAFGEGGIDAADLIGSLRSAVPAEGGLVHAALDGETFGHHRPFGELGLAYTLFEGAQREGLVPTSYAAWLADNPPVDEVEIVGGQGTAWSCAHGVGRWSRDCGCSTDGEEGWNQAWRGPLRSALDIVRDAAVAVFEERGGDLLRDPWRARNDYIGVRLGTVTPAAFLERHARRNLTDRQATEIWTLLESQRNAMVMYTSCGWFFSDVSGIETVYVLRFAARVLGLLSELGAGDGTEEAFLEALAEARSNKPEVGTGADVWRQQVEPAEVTPRRIAAHLALLGLSQPEAAADFPVGSSIALAGHTVVVWEGRVERRGRVALLTARLNVTVTDTGQSHDLGIAGLHLGGLDFHGISVPLDSQPAFAEECAELWEALPTEPMAHLLRRVWRLGDHPGGDEFGLELALPGGRQIIVGTVFSDLTERFHEQYSRLYGEHRRILEMLTAAGYELPRDLRAAAELTLDAELERQVAEARQRTAEGVLDVTTFDDVRSMIALAHEQGYSLELGGLQRAVTDAVTAAAAAAARSLRTADADVVERWLELAGELELSIDLSPAQELIWDVATRAKAGRLGPDEADVVARLGARLGLAPVAWSRRD